MMYNPKSYDSMPLGIILRRAPGLTRWVKWNWTVSSVVLGTREDTWRELRQEGDITDYFAGSVALELHGAETGAYLHELGSRTPSVYVIMREGGEAAPWQIVLATASPYEAQDYADNGEDVIEKVAMSEALRDWVTAFVEKHHNEENFVKRKRDRLDVEKSEDGIGDPRIEKAGDIYASPALKRGRLQ